VSTAPDRNNFHKYISILNIIQVCLNSDLGSILDIAKFSTGLK
jgi:hypothetical protein